MTNIALNPGNPMVPAALLQAQSENSSPPILRQYLRIAMRWRYVILGAVAVCFLIGLIATLLMTPQYTASSTRSAEHTSELQSLMRISYAVFCLITKKSRTTRLTPSAPISHYRDPSSLINIAHVLTP